MWDFGFQALFKVILNTKSLSTELIVTNTDKKPFSFSTAVYIQGYILLCSQLILILHMQMPHSLRNLLVITILEEAGQKVSPEMAAMGHGAPPPLSEYAMVLLKRKHTGKDKNGCNRLGHKKVSHKKLGGSQHPEHLREKIMLSTTQSPVHTRENPEMSSMLPILHSSSNRELSTGQSSMQQCSEVPTAGKKKNGRKKSKGLKNLTPGEKLEVPVSDERFLRAEARTEMGVLFGQSLKGPYSKWSIYPIADRETLWERYKSHFSFDCTEDEAKVTFYKNVARLYPTWMFRIRQKCFKEYKTTEERYKHPADFISSDIWRQLVDTWSTDKFKAISERNKKNRAKGRIFHTTGSVPFAQCHAIVSKQTGHEPGPLVMWSYTHLKKDGVHWGSEAAKKIHDVLQQAKAKAISEGSSFDELHAYRQIVGNPKHGIVKGYGAGVKPSTLFGMEKGCSARCREERRKEAEEFEARLDARVNATVPAIVQTVLQSLGITPPPNLGDVQTNENQGVEEDENEDESEDESEDDNENEDDEEDDGNEFENDDEDEEDDGGNEDEDNEDGYDDEDLD